MRSAGRLECGRSRAGSVLQVRYLGKPPEQSVASVAAEIGAPSLNKQYPQARRSAADHQGAVAGQALSRRGGHPSGASLDLLYAPGDLRPRACGEPIWFDDGKIGGVIETVEPRVLRVRITTAEAGGSRLGADKGINLPESDLHLPGLTEKDVAAIRDFLSR
jgi:hypothetical protein